MFEAVGVVFLSAGLKQIGELQVELKRRRQVNEQLQQQQSQINSLRKIVCAMNPTPELCHK
jgi:hypothetical protein